MLTLFRLATDTAALPNGRGFPLPVAAKSMCRLATGRSVLLHLIKRLPPKHAETVLLPSYVAEGVIRPFRASGFKTLFYRLKSDLRPIPEDVATLLGEVRGTAVIVLIHYFGFSAHSAELSAVLKRHRPVVVDDFAHAPFAAAGSEKVLAESTELGLYSLNKFLPVTDGAILTSNRPDIDLSINESELPELPDDAQQAYRDHLQSARHLFESNDPAQARVLLNALHASYERYYSVINADLRPFRQSSSSQRTEQAFSIDRLIEQRSINSRILHEGLHSTVFSLVYPASWQEAVPFCIPARVPARRRSEILDRLFEQGILLATLQDKWDFVPDGRRRYYSVEAAFLDEHVLIPISEFITTVSMRQMVKRLNEI